MAVTQKIVDKWTVCRICLQSSEHEMEPIFDTAHGELCIQIRVCIGLQLIQNDKLPNKICLSCQLLLKAALKLRTLAKRSQRDLSDMLQVPTMKEYGNEELLEEKRQSTLSQSTKEGNMLFEVEPIYSTAIGEETNTDFDTEVYDAGDFDVDYEQVLDEDIAREAEDEVIPDYNIDYPPSEIKDNSLIQNELDEFLQPAKKIKESLERVRKQSPRKFVECPKANKIVKEKVVINGRNRKQTSAITYVCNVCGNVYPDRIKLAAHIKIHNEIKPHECEICHKRFRQTPQLARHMNSHTGNRPYACNFCEASFADPSTCIKHQRIHTNERPYKCEICGSAFAYSNVLKVHSKMHTGEKPYSCRYCERNFTQLHHKKAHERSHVDTPDVIYILNEE